ncbi:MAG: calcineurin-like phosphoesterase family protein [Bacteroidales bacterium]|nr:calcineurin-like phosphoesterase family protein [Bacteroidales bacterium]
MITYIYKHICRALAIAGLSVILVSCSENGPGKKPSMSWPEVAEGVVRYSDGAPASGVVISDGHNCTATDKNGKYSLNLHVSARYVSCSLPSDAQIETGGAYGLPMFFVKILPGAKFDFTLKRCDVQKKFRLLALGDPQVGSESEVSRFATETIADVQSYIESKNGDMPSFAMTMGDMVANKWTLFPKVFSAMNITKTGIPVFQTIGNHDHEYPTSSDAAASVTYENYAGPLMYSFNRGDCHILSMDDVIHTAQNASDYDDGFLEWQYEWAKQDLSYVDPSKTVILCIHIPFRDGFSNGFFKGSGYRKEMLELLGRFDKAIIIAGHTHNVLNKGVNKGSSWTLTGNGKKIDEYIVGTACGAWWKGTICTDGAPNGYAVFEFYGTKLVNQIYKGVRCDEDFQMRVYRAWEFPAYTSSEAGMTLKWGLKSEAGRGVINAWNADASWTFEVYENGVATGKAVAFDAELRDMWAKNYFYKTLLIKSTNGYPSSSAHMYSFNITDVTTDDIKIVARDGYGNTFTCQGYTKPNDTSCANYLNK